MIVFECPSCQTKLQVAEEHAGATIQCPKCKQAASAPKSAGAEAITATTPAAPPSPPPTAVTTERRARLPDRDSADDKGATGKKAAAGIGVGMVLLIVFGVMGCCVVPVLIALLVPAVQKVREAAARTQSVNNLKQIGLAFHGFNDVHRRMPFNGSDLDSLKAPPGTYRKTAVPMSPTSGSWAFQILPFLEQQNNFMQIDRNAAIPVYMCPGRSRPMTEAKGGPWTDYFYNNYLNDPMQSNRADAPDSRRTIMEFTDGTSNTVMAGHGNISIDQYQNVGNVTLSSNIYDGGTTGTMRAGNPGEASPGGVTLSRDSNVAPTIGSWGGPFNVAVICMGDGSVRMFPYNAPGFNAMLTPRGDEVVVLP